MIFKNISILNENFQLEENMYVGIKNDKIDYIGKENPQGDYGESYDGKGKLLMSGFYNSHAHSPMTLLRGYGENLALQDWLNQRIFPFEAKLDGNAVYWGTMLAMAESLRYGIVSTTDMYYFCEDMVKAIDESGAKNNLGRGVTNFSDASLYDLESFSEMKALYENYHNAANGRIKVDMSLHAEYTSNPKTVYQMAEYTKSIGANMHVHVSETKLEHEECKKRQEGLTPIQYLNRLGVLDNKTTAAHCVWVEPEDMDIIKQKEVTVASNPISNLKLSSGVCNVPELLRRGINVAIGTDSVSSNNSLNFIEEMKVFAISSKEKYQDPTAVTPVETLTAATIAGAKGQGRENCGKLAVGYKADLIVLDIMRPNFIPVHQMVNNIVYSACGGDIILTMVDGKVLYKNGDYMTIDIERTIFETNHATQKILAML
ncbi:amidohydrolase [Clostridium aminobutyricum]|uniref:Amidohydrolase n=1 Tax=Clostridium aminobutyricum TaxID=33953 RepID=A0A939IHS4_CLOAM|nr:amidohydrolase [Clostridium aminobutyricum]MBN7774162.1 amidohydrolase [Clostridium aminobutyricum]